MLQDKDYSTYNFVQYNRENIIFYDNFKDLYTKYNEIKKTITKNTKLLSHISIDEGYIGFSIFKYNFLEAGISNVKYYAYSPFNNIKRNILCFDDKSTAAKEINKHKNCKNKIYSSVNIYYQLKDRNAFYCYCQKDENIINIVYCNVKKIGMIHRVDQEGVDDPMVIDVNKCFKQSDLQSYIQIAESLLIPNKYLILV